MFFLSIIRVKADMVCCLQVTLCDPYLSAVRGILKDMLYRSTLPLPLPLCVSTVTLWAPSDAMMRGSRQASPIHRATVDDVTTLDTLLHKEDSNKHSTHISSTSSTLLGRRSSLSSVSTLWTLYINWPRNTTVIVKIVTQFFWPTV